MPEPPLQVPRTDLVEVGDGLRNALAKDLDLLLKTESRNFTVGASTDTLVLPAKNLESVLSADDDGTTEFRATDS